MVSKKKKDKQDKKSFIKKRDLKKLRELKNRNKARKNIIVSNTNSFEKIMSSYKEIVNKRYRKNMGINEYLNLSFLNMISSYLKDCACPEKNDFNFIQKFTEITTILSMNENEFIFWTLLIDKYTKNNKNEWNLEILFYIGLYSKINLNPNYLNIINEYKQINNGFNIWYNSNQLFFGENLCLLEEFNQRYTKLNKMKSFKTICYHDYNSKVEYICNPNGDTIVEENKASNLIEKSKESINSDSNKKVDEIINKKNEVKKNENVNNEDNINKDDIEGYQNNTINFNDVNFVNGNNGYNINNYIDEGVMAKNEDDQFKENNENDEKFPQSPCQSYSERKLSPNPYDDYNIFVESFDEMCKNENYDLDNMLEQENEADGKNFHQDEFNLQYNQNPGFKFNEI
jgi:hypothetical protein